MTTGWINRSDWFNFIGIDNKNAFKKHARKMEIFHRHHPSERELRASLFKSMRIFRAVHIMRETGGKTGLITAKSRLTPMPEVSLCRFSRS